MLPQALLLSIVLTPIVFPSVAHALIGGRLTSRAEYPSLAVIEELGCSAVIIDATTALTAAHCFFPPASKRRTPLFDLSTSLSFDQASWTGDSHTRLRYEDFSFAAHNIAIHPRVDLAVIRFSPAAVLASDGPTPTPLTLTPLQVGDRVELAGFGLNASKVGTSLIQELTDATASISMAAQGPLSLHAGPGDSGGPVYRRRNVHSSLEVVALISGSSDLSPYLSNNEVLAAAARGELFTEFVRVDTPEIQTWIRSVPPRQPPSNAYN